MQLELDTKAVDLVPQPKNDDHASAVAVRRLENASARAEQVRKEAAKAERAAYRRWQNALAEYRVVRDEATDAWTEWMDAIGT